MSTTKKPPTSPRPAGVGGIPRGSSGDRADDAAADAPGDVEDGCDPVRRQDQLLDEGVEETFPASDPVSVKRIT